MASTPFLDLLRMPLERAEWFAETVESAVAKNCLAIVADLDFGTAIPHIVRPEWVGLEKDEHEEIEHYLFWADGVLQFVFSRPPESAVQVWLEHFDEDGEDVALQAALERIEFLRTKLPLLNKLWLARLDSLVPILGDIEVQHQSGDTTGVLVSIWGSTVNWRGVARAALDGTVRPLVVRMDRAQVEYAVGALSRSLEQMRMAESED